MGVRQGDGEDRLHGPATARGSRHKVRAASRRWFGVRVSGLSDMDDGDLDAVEGVEHPPMRSERHGRKVEHDKGVPEKTASGAPKVWKLPFWKRRGSGL